MLPVGNPAVGKDFMNREHEIRTIMNALKKDNILLIAPRRYGKTSVMKKIQALLKGSKGDDTAVIFIDVYDVYCPEEFVIELATGAFDVAKNKRSFIEKLKQFFSQQLKDLEFEFSLGELKVRFKRSLKEEIEKGGWKQEGKAVFTFIQSYFDVTIYFIIDEFSECVHNMSIKDAEKAEVFLKWFRSVREGGHNLKFILGGSMSIDRVVKRVATLSTINNFRRVILNGFDKETVLCIVKKVFKEEKWEYTPGIGEKIIECIGTPSVPYFLSVFLSILQETCTGGLDESVIEEVYSNSLMGTNGKHYFDYYIQRLATYYEDDAAKAILKELCQTGVISKDAAFDIFKRVTAGDYELFLDLVSDLENDFYLEHIGDTFMFSSKPLADWWRLYHV
jgi:hypothetical protein